MSVGNTQPYVLTNFASSKFGGATILIIVIRSMSIAKHTGNVRESVLLHANLGFDFHKDGE